MVAVSNWLLSPIPFLFNPSNYCHQHCNRWACSHTCHTQASLSCNTLISRCPFTTGCGDYLSSVTAHTQACISDGNPTKIILAISQSLLGVLEGIELTCPSSQPVQFLPPIDASILCKAPIFSFLGSRERVIHLYLKKANASWLNLTITWRMTARDWAHSCLQQRTKPRQHWKYFSFALLKDAIDVIFMEYQLPLP